MIAGTINEHFHLMHKTAPCQKVLFYRYVIMSERHNRALKYTICLNSTRIGYPVANLNLI